MRITRKPSYAVVEGAQTLQKSAGDKMWLRRLWCEGFSLIEILVTVALLSLIILGLVAMFSQTRRAFTSSLTQVDVLGAGRAAADMIAREIEQMTPVGLGTNVANFYVDTSGTYLPLRQSLVDPSDLRTNTLQALYFITSTYNPSRNVQWNMIGYKVSGLANSIGSLYRFSYNNVSAANLASVLYSNNPPVQTFLNTTNLTQAGATNFSRIIDGVVDFRILAYDTNGNLFGFTNRNTYLVTNSSNPNANDFYYGFSSNSLPAYVEIELGIIEDRTLARYQALTNGLMSTATTYLANHAGQVHMFRQRIPIRNVNPAAYQ